MPALKSLVHLQKATKFFWIPFSDKLSIINFNCSFQEVIDVETNINTHGSYLQKISLKTISLAHQSVKGQL